MQKLQFPINFVLEVSDQDEYDIIAEGIEKIKAHLEGEKPMFGAPGPEISTLVEMIGRTKTKRVNSTTEARVRINGTEIAMGTKEDMVARFRAECDMHQSSNVIMEEWENGDYKVVKARRHQRG